MRAAARADADHTMNRSIPLEPTAYVEYEETCPVVCQALGVKYQALGIICRVKTRLPPGLITDLILG
jgi:hypothetical protein